MIKSELAQRISSQNPHLYQRDIEKIVSATKLLVLCVAEIESNCGVSEPFQLSSEDHVKGAILVLVRGRGRKESYSRLQDGKGDARAA
jgi:hypothetical protein